MSASRFRSSLPIDDAGVEFPSGPKAWWGAPAPTGPHAHRQAGYAAGALFIAGALLVTLSTFLPMGPGTERIPLYVMSVVAIATGVAFIALPTRIPMRLYYTANAAGSILVGGVVFYSDASVAAAFGVLYVFVAAYAFMFFRADVAVGLTVFAGISFAVSLGSHPGDPSIAPIVVVFGGCVMAGALIGTLGRQARGLAERRAEAAERLRELDSMRSIFLQALSHELRTPLAIILGVSETLVDHPGQLTEGQIRDLAVRQSAHARRLLRMIEDLLDVDRLAAGRLTPRPQHIRIDEVVERCVARLDLGRHERRASELHPLEGEVDPAYVERIVEQLVSNVVTHTPAGTAFAVTVAPAGDGAWVRIGVTDDGPGIAADERELVFETFHREDDYRPGIGVGLALVRHLTEAHGGRVWIEGPPSGGTSVHVELPLHVDAAIEAIHEEHA